MAYTSRLTWHVFIRSMKLKQVYFRHKRASVAQRQSVGIETRGFETRLCHLVFPLRKEISRHCWATQFAGNAYWADHCSPIGRAPLPSSVKTSTWCLHWGEETAVQAVVGSILLYGRFAGAQSGGVWRLAPAATLYSVRPNFPFFPEVPRNCLD